MREIVILICFNAVLQQSESGGSKCHLHGDVEMLHVMSADWEPEIRVVSRSRSASLHNWNVRVQIESTHYLLKQHDHQQTHKHAEWRIYSFSGMRQIYCSTRQITDSGV